MIGSTDGASFVAVENGRLHVEQAGSGPDILLVHSGITDSGMWEGQFGPLSNSFRVTRYDMRGYGQSSAIDSAYSHVDDLERLIDALGLDRPVVIAASMGARVVLDLALREPDLFDRLLLVGPAVSGFGFEDPALHACWDEMGAAWGAGDIEKAIDIETRFWMNGPTRAGDGVDESVLEHVRRMQRRIVELQPDDDPEVGEPAPASDRLEQLSMPVLIVVGQHDVSDIRRNAQAIQECASGVRIVYLPDTGHLPNLELVDEFNRIVRDFLA